MDHGLHMGPERSTDAIWPPASTRAMYLNMTSGDNINHQHQFSPMLQHPWTTSLFSEVAQAIDINMVSGAWATDDSIVFGGSLAHGHPGDSIDHKHLCSLFQQCGPEHSTEQQLRPQTSIWPLAIAWITSTFMVLEGSTGHGHVHGFQSNTIHSYQHVLQWQHSPWTSTWLQVAAQTTVICMV